MLDDRVYGGDAHMYLTEAYCLLMHHAVVVKRSQIHRRLSEAKKGELLGTYRLIPHLKESSSVLFGASRIAEETGKRNVFVDCETPFESRSILYDRGCNVEILLWFTRTCDQGVLSGIRSCLVITKRWALSTLVG